MDQSIKKIFSEEEIELLQNPPYKLTLSFEELISPAENINKPSRTIKKTQFSTIMNNNSKVTSTVTLINKNATYIKTPRPQNAWVLFRKDYGANQRLKFPGKVLKMRNISTDASENWRNETIKVRRFFYVLSKLAYEKHKSIYPNYKYIPKKRTQKDNNSTLKTLIFRDFVQQQQRKQKKDVKNNNVNNDINRIPCLPSHFSSSLSTSLSPSSSVSCFRKTNVNIDLDLDFNSDFNCSNFNYNDNMNFNIQESKFDINNMNDNVNL